MNYTAFPVLMITESNSQSGGESSTDREKKPRRKNKRWPLLAAIVATILILAGFAYWYSTNVPDLEGFMDGSYSPGEKAEFRAKVTEMELLETSYGSAMLVYFDDYGMPFCFLGNHSGKYEEGKTVTVEVTFHNYDIDGLKIVMLEELILGFYLQLEEVFLDISHRAGIGLTGTMDLETPEFYYLNVSTLKYPHKTFPIDLYEHALNRIYGYDYVDDNVETYIGDGEGKYGKKGSFGSDCIIFTEMIYMNSIALCDLEINCTRQMNDLSYFPDRIQFMDRDNDRNISLGDSYRIDMEPTDSQYDLNFYIFNIGGITAGANFILNWYDGPFYSLNRLTYYSFGSADEELSNGKYSVRIPVHKISSGFNSLGDVNVFISESGYQPIQIIKGEMNDSMNVTLDPSSLLPDSRLFDVIFSFHDVNDNGFLDGGDCFQFENLKKDARFEFMMKDSEHRLVFRWSYTVSRGIPTGQYPLISMNKPFSSEGNISINVSGVDARFPEINGLDYVLIIPEKNLRLELNYHANEKYSDDGTMRFATNDTDRDGSLTKGDRLEIDGLEPGIDYIFKILGWHGYPVYELEATA